MHGQQIRQRRTAAGIPGSAVSSKAGIHRSRLSEIERGYITPSEEELGRLNRALDALIDARKKVAEVAAEVGWPF